MRLCTTCSTSVTILVVQPVEAEPVHSQSSGPTVSCAGHHTTGRTRVGERRERVRAEQPRQLSARGCPEQGGVRIHRENRDLG